MKNQIKISTPSSRAKEPKGQESPYPLKRGLAAMSPEKRRQIASMGGKATTARGFNDPDTAKRAGQKSGQSRRNELDNERASAQDDK